MMRLFIVKYVRVMRVIVDAVAEVVSVEEVPVAVASLPAEPLYSLGMQSDCPQIQSFSCNTLSHLSLSTLIDNHMTS